MHAADALNFDNKQILPSYSFQRALHNGIQRREVEEKTRNFFNLEIFSCGITFCLLPREDNTRLRAARADNSTASALLPQSTPHAQRKDISISAGNKILTSRSLAPHAAKLSCAGCTA